MSDFIAVCELQDLIEGAGVAALVNQTQVALYYLNGEVFALNNYDPVGKAYVMSRGMIGDLKGELMVASPLQKLHYSLKTGRCLDKEGITIPRYDVQVKDGKVWVCL